MIDHVTRERRTEIMRAIHSKGTLPELAVRKAAHRIGLRFRLHVKTLPGCPDLVFPKWSTVIFVNGCFWHRHEGCKRTSVPKTNTDFWQRKFENNILRDQANYKRLTDLGWRVLILWQCEIKSVEEAITVIRRYFPNIMTKAK